MYTVQIKRLGKWSPPWVLQAGWAERATAFAKGGTTLRLRETQQARSPQSLSALVAVAVAFECPDTGGGVRVP